MNNMIEEYEKFLNSLDKRLDKYFEDECENIKCKPGCSECCEVGEYPFSRLEMEYLMYGFSKLPKEKKYIVKLNIDKLKKDKPKMHKCPFLIDKKCSIYQYRGIVCRVHGLAWYDENENRIRLPYCVNKGLNYSKVFDRETGEVFVQNPIRERLRIDDLLKSKEAKKLGLECGEIRPLMKWF